MLGSALVSPQHPQWPEVAAACAYAWLALSEHSEPERLDQAIAALVQVVAALEDGEARRRQYLAELGFCQLRRAERFGDVRAAAGAVEHLRACVDPTAIDTADEAADAVNLALALVRLHALRDDSDGGLLEEAEDLLSQAAHCSALTQDQRVTALLNLGALFSDRHGGQQGALRLLEESVAVAREALTHTREGSVERMRCLANLGIGLCQLAEKTQNLAHLREAETFLRAALDSEHAGHEERSQVGAALAFARQRLTGDTGGVELLRAAVEGFPEGDPRRGRALLNLAGAALWRYEQVGDLDSIAQHRDLLREALQGTPASSRLRSTPMLALAQALILSGSADEVAEGQQLLRRLGESPWAPIAEVSYANGLRGKVLHDRFLVSRAKAVALLRATAAMTAYAAPQEGYPLRERAVAPVVPADDALMRGKGDLALLEEAVGLLRRAVTEPGDGSSISQRAWLSQALGSLYLYTGDASHLDEALALARNLLGRTPNTPVRALLGRLLRIRHGAQGGRSVLAEAAEHYGWAAADATLGSLAHLYTTVDWARCEAELGRSSQAAGAYAQALDLLELVPWSASDRPGQMQVLTSHIGLASEAAAHAVDSGATERALELLEQGRGLILGHVLDSRAAHHRVAAVSAELAKAFEDVHKRIEELPSPDAMPAFPADGVPSGNGIDRLDVTSARMAAVQERQELVEQIQSLPGLADFLRPPSCAELRLAAQGGPVAVLNVSRLRCDALLVTPNKVRAVPLPAVTEAVALTYAHRFAIGVALLGKSDSEALQIAGRDMVISTLRWLWDSVCAPVLSALGLTRRADPDRPPRMWWCPTGPLISLPLHAAGRHGSRHEAAPQTVMDRVVSSYTPTLRSLVALYARPAQPPASGDRPLAVSVATSGAASETEPGTTPPDAETFASAFPGTRVLTGTQATRDQVLAGLPHSPWVHFACHGETGRADTGPLLRLTDSTLTVTDLTAVALERAEFAFLSACESSLTPGRFADESLNMASAMRLAGYRHVIGTLWPISGDHAAQVAAQLYPRLTAPDGRPPNTSHTAVALHRSVLALREDQPSAVTTWGAYLHMGP
ncbi:hypothetical protein DMA15_30250 [Streptomyces sp. WAC 01529]|nr:hypothetical protein DMA15_30250 [Streptomyces sp. WAC 01529]